MKTHVRQTETVGKVRRLVRTWQTVVVLSLTVVTTLLAGCTKPSPAQPRLLLILLDETSSFVVTGYWADSLEVARSAVFLLRPGDQVCVIGVDDHAFDYDDVRIPVTELPRGALASTQAKKVLIQKIAALKPRPTSSGWKLPDGSLKSHPKGTDVLGAIHHAAHFASRADRVVSVIACSDFQDEPTTESSGQLQQAASFPPQTRFVGMFVVERGGREWDARVNRWIQKLRGLNIDCTDRDFHTGSESKQASILSKLLAKRAA